MLTSIDKWTIDNYKNHHRSTITLSPPCKQSCQNLSVPMVPSYLLLTKTPPWHSNSCRYRSWWLRIIPPPLPSSQTLWIQGWCRSPLCLYGCVRDPPYRQRHHCCHYLHQKKEAFWQKEGIEFGFKAAKLIYKEVDVLDNKSAQCLGQSFPGGVKECCTHYWAWWIYLSSKNRGEERF